MVPGLKLTSLAMLLMGATLFQRKSRSGWLDELDGIRADALAVPHGEVSAAMAAVDSHGPADPGGDLGLDSWQTTDADPWNTERHPANHRPAATPASTEHGAQRSDPTEETVVVNARDIAESAINDALGLTPTDPDAAVDDWWLQPAPHPVRPHEMWHAGGAPTALSPAGPEGLRPEQRVDSDDLAGHGGMRRFARYRPTARPAPAAAPAAAAELAAFEISADEAARVFGTAGGTAEPAARPAMVPDPEALFGGPDPVEAPLVPIETERSGTSLLPGPVGRRRTDKAAPARPTLPGGALRRHAEDGADEVSPLPSPALPPAAPARTTLAAAIAAAGPQIERPDPSTVFDAVEVAPAAESIAEPLGAPAPAVAPEPVVEAPAALALSIGSDDALVVATPIVRFSPDRAASAVVGATGPAVVLDSGWCWVAPRPGVAPMAGVHLTVPNAVLTVDPGASALAVVETDGSTFILVAGGSAEVSRDGSHVRLERGTMVLLPAAGAPQIDQAGDDEIGADPIVVQNRALDRQR